MEKSKYLKLEFPSFITHVPVSKNNWLKIGYNKIHTGLHFSTRASVVACIHGYLENYIPDDLVIETPVQTKFIIYAPINYGSVKMVKVKDSNKRKLQWSKPSSTYRPNWDLGNLAFLWLKALDDVLKKKGILPDDTVEFLSQTTYEFVEIEEFQERKLIYIIKTIEK